MKFIDWFAGIGGFRKGMEQAGHECVGFCEFDKFAVASYVSMHCITDEQREYLKTLDFKKRQKEILKDEYRNGEWFAPDVRRVSADDIPKADCWCFGFPCQDISVSGFQRGFQGSRSSLFFRVMYLAGQVPEEKRPHTLFIENVKNLLSVNGGWDFARLLIEMDKAGYDAEWDVLNSKEFGVPQNRERCFIIGHSRERCRSEVFPVEGTDREDCFRGGGNVEVISRDDNKGYKRIAHVPYENGRISAKTGVYDTDSGVPATTATQGKDPYRVGIPVIRTVGGVNSSQDGKVFDVNGISQTQSAGHGNTPKVAIPVITPDRANKRQHGRRFKEDGDPSFTSNLGVLRTVRSEFGKAIRKQYEAAEIKISRHKFLQHEIREDGMVNTLDTVQKDNLLAVEVKEATKQGYSVARGGRDSVNYSVPGSKTRRGRVGVDMANTLDTGCNQGIFVKLENGNEVYAVWYPKKECYIAIRKLTPRECFRLQGWDDEDFDKAQFVNSDSQLYKQAGNGVTVSVIKAIAERFE